MKIKLSSLILAIAFCRKASSKRTLSTLQSTVLTRCLLTVTVSELSWKICLIVWYSLILKKAGVRVVDGVCSFF